ncbi:MAG: transcription termination factor NusA [Planctomycetota bacterium]|jgi:N utilization substance protein A
MNTDLLRLVDAISRDKSIEKENVYADLEAAMVSACHKAYEEAEDVSVIIDRATGAITATVDGQPIDMTTLGRIATQTAKQVMMQKIREDERSSIFDEYSERVGTIVTGTVARFEGGSLTVNLGRAEGFLPRSEQIPGDTHHPGERIRAMVLDVREEQSRVKIVLTQTHPDYIRKLFELEVPEVAERIIEIKALAREAGYRTKIAVSSIDTKVDAVGACVGVRGSRIRNIVDELGGEKIDIVRWNESSQVLISNALKPAEVRETFLCFELGRATVLVDEDQLSLAIGKRGQNVRLAARLTGWDIDICTPPEYDKNVEQMDKLLRGVEGVPEVALDKILAMGMVSVADIAEVGIEPLVNDLEFNEDLAAKVVEIAAAEAKKIEAAKEAEKKAAEAARAAEANAEASAEQGAAAEGDQADSVVSSPVPVGAEGAVAAVPAAQSDESAVSEDAESGTDVAGEDKTAAVPEGMVGAPMDGGDSVVTETPPVDASEDT